DPAYRPRQSWVVEEEAGRLAAHLRVFERTILLQETEARVAGIGNVITVRRARGQGYASLLLRTVLEALPGEGYVYSLLGTAVPALYARYGWVEIEQQVGRATLSTFEHWLGQLAAFRPEDLVDVMALYATSNATRTGPTVRTEAYWRAQLTWLREDRDGFLVARRPDGALAGYVRSRARAGAPTEILELSLPAAHIEAARPLLGRLVQQDGPALKAHLPPSLLGVFRPDERVLFAEHGLMGRVLNIGRLVQMLRPVWERRLRAAGLAGAALRLETSDGYLDVQTGAGTPPVLALDEARLARLLFHGCDTAPDAAQDDEALRVLFPPQDFVLWPADDF
ncbi:MAG: GNAT family N-acetyltransferase, partial [Chloroflexi bacterium]|nr:GNAT family N-acetyltransferase [Chloroflexota bacterium]